MEKNQEQPLLTIITVVYNCVSLLEATILSVLNQEHLDVEYIVIDGGSTDGSLELIKKYESRLTRWVSEPDKGIFDAMNKGISLSQGKYIGFLNAGDYYEMGAFDKVSRIIQSNRNYGVIYGNTNLIVSVGVEKYSSTIIPNLIVDDRLMIAPVFCHQSSFVKRLLFLEYGNFENVSIAGDWLHFVTLYKNNVGFLHFNETISNYLEGGASTTAKGFKESFEFKRKFGTFKLKDYFTLLVFYIKDNTISKKYFNTLLWKIKISVNKSKYKKIQ